MTSISRGMCCNFNGASSLHRLNSKGGRALQSKFLLGKVSIHRTGNLNLQRRNVKVLALENKDFPQLGSGAESSERAGSASGNNTVYASSKEDIESEPPKALSRSEELLQKLKRYGVAGVLSYGLLNTFYYLGAFLFVWFYVAPAPGGMGYLPAAQRFLKILAMVWAGSQVTKLLRAGGALAVAPFVDRGLSWFTTQFRFKSRGSAFGVIVFACVGLVVSLFTTMTLLWA